MNIAETLREARLAANLTQRALASHMKIAASYLCDIELGRREFPEKLLDSMPYAISERVRPAVVRALEGRIEKINGNSG